MTEHPKSKLEEHDQHLLGPQGFWYRLTHDNEGKDKLEDSHPANTFVELLLWGILVITVLGFILDVVVNLSEFLHIFGLG